MTEEISDYPNVIDIFSRRPIHSPDQHKIIRIAPEYDGLEMLYSNDVNTDKLFSLKILCWGLTRSGEVVGLVPWLDRITPCSSLQDPLNGHWEGYYDPALDDIFYNAPSHKITELNSAAQYYENHQYQADEIVQELPDTIGTHAVFSGAGPQSFNMLEILSWRLLGDGQILGMLVDDNAVQSTPVLPGDDCLYAAQPHEHFKYFFQHRIANKIKQHDPEALAAISLLMDQ